MTFNKFVLISTCAASFVYGALNASHASAMNESDEGCSSSSMEAEALPHPEVDNLVASFRALGLNANQPLGDPSDPFYQSYLQVCDYLQNKDQTLTDEQAEGMLITIIQDAPLTATYIPLSQFLLAYMVFISKAKTTSNESAALYLKSLEATKVLPRACTQTASFILAMLQVFHRTTLISQVEAAERLKILAKSPHPKFIFANHARFGLAKLAFGDDIKPKYLRDEELEELLLGLRKASDLDNNSRAHVKFYLGIMGFQSRTKILPRKDCWGLLHEGCAAPDLDWSFQLMGKFSLSMGYLRQEHTLLNPDECATILKTIVTNPKANEYYKLGAKFYLGEMVKDNKTDLIPPMQAAQYLRDVVTTNHPNTAHTLRSRLYLALLQLNRGLNIMPAAKLKMELLQLAKAADPFIKNKAIELLGRLNKETDKAKPQDMIIGE